MGKAADKADAVGQMVANPAPVNAFARWRGPQIVNPQIHCHLRPEFAELRPDRHAGGIIHQTDDDRGGQYARVGVSDEILAPVDRQFDPVVAMADIFHVEEPAMAEFAHQLVDQRGVKARAFRYDAAEIRFAKRHLFVFQ